MQFQKVPAVILSVLSAAVPCRAQGIGVGARMSMVRGDVQADPNATAQRFTGGQLRARISPRTSVEISIDRRTETTTDLTERVRDYPLQGSLLLFPIRSTFSPFVLGGVGWYTHVVDTMAAGKAVESVSARKMGYHAGFGAELKLARHAGVHADYRYTMVHFGDGAASATQTAAKSLSGARLGTDGLASRFMPSYDGSMWTAGVTFYF